MRWLCLLLVLFGASLAHAQQSVEPGDIKLELELEERAQPPHPGEMILLTIHGTYRIPVVRENLVQPALDGIDWMQLGEDHWYKAFEDGFEVLKLMRRMALFPQRSGDIEIPPFTHELDLIPRQRAEVSVELVSNSLTLTAAPPLETADWWFPVRNLEIADQWSNQPEALDPGSAALRVVTLIVDGAPPQRIPPMPEMTGAGAFIFPHPEHRIVSLGPDGPITRVFWRWTVRPHEASAGYLNPVKVPYFDTKTREFKEITLSSERVAYAGGVQEVRSGENIAQTQQPAVATSDESTWKFGKIPGWALPVLTLLGLALGLPAMLGGQSWRVPQLFRRDPLVTELKRAIKRKDLRRVRTLAHQVLAARGKSPPDAVQHLDRAVYGIDGTAPDLRDVARSIQAKS